MNFSTSSQKVSDLNRYFQIINPYPYGVYCIGYKSSEHPLAFPGIYIDSGTSVNQRIGLKVNPVKLRIFGAVNILHKDNVPGESAPSEYIGQQVTQRIHLRLIVLQVRNGNTDYYPDREEFSSVNPYVTQLDNDTIYNNFNDIHYYLDEGFFGRMFSKVATMTAATRAVGNHNVNWHGYDLKSSSDAFWQNSYLKSPYRLGIGGSVRILKDKLYSVTPQTSQSIPFRFKTKKPSRMVWPESRDEDNMEAPICKNPIYVCVIPVFPWPTYPSRVQVDMNVEMFYTDL